MGSTLHPWSTPPFGAGTRFGGQSAGNESPPTSGPTSWTGPFGLAGCWLREGSEAHGREPECCHDPASALLRPLVRGNVERQLAVWGPGRPHCRERHCLSRPGRARRASCTRESPRILPVRVSFTNIVRSGRSSEPMGAAEVLTAGGVMAGSCLWPAVTPADSPSSVGELVLSIRPSTVAARAAPAMRSCKALAQNDHRGCARECNDAADAVSRSSETGASLRWCVPLEVQGGTHGRLGRSWP
jgi:hypothetical protein